MQDGKIPFFPKKAGKTGKFPQIDACLVPVFRNDAAR
jgi:hypothetical protein